MFIGRQQLGTELTIGVLCHDASDTPTAPAAAPTIEVWTGTTKLLTGQMIPVMDRYGTTVAASYFQYNLFLDGKYAAGQYKVLYRYTVGSYVGLEEDTFQVLAGGDADGTITSLIYYSRPQAAFVVWQTDAGKVQKGRNPAI